MEAPSSAVYTQTELTSPGTSTTPPILRLRLQKKKSPKKVVWSDGTVDNEHMNKKKSKCCCIYRKPTEFGESSSEEEDECEHCVGHPEKRLKTQTHNPDDPMASTEVVENDLPDTHQCSSGVCTLKSPEVEESVAE